MLGKRGISPLIATVLLIAFAVSIGTMIMNWGKDVVASAGECDDTKMVLQTVNNQPLFCYDTENKNINIMLKNNGDMDINKLQLSVTAQDFSHEEYIIEDSSLKVGAVLTKSVHYNKEGGFKVEIIPLITVAGKERTCINSAIVAETIPACN